MNQKNQPTAIESLRNRRKAVLRLSELQLELRQAFVQRMEKEGLNVSEAANAANAPWKSVQSLVAGTRAFGHGSTLKSLAVFVGKPELHKAMEAITEDLNDRLVGATLLSKKIINLSFDVHETYLFEGEGESFAAFASVFDDLADMVAGILFWRVEDMRRLEDEGVYGRLESFLLSDELASRLAKTKQNNQERARTAAEELKALGERLLRGQIVQCKLAETLNVGPDTVSRALAAQAPPAKIEELVALAKEKLAQRDNRSKGNGKPADKTPETSRKTETAAKPKSDRPKASDNPSMEPANRLKAIVSRLRTVYGSEPRLAQDLKTSLNTLHDAMNGRMGVDATNSMVERAKRLAEATFPSRPMATAALPGRIGFGGQTRFRGQEDPTLAAPSAPVLTPAAPTPVPPALTVDAQPPSEPKAKVSAHSAGNWPVGRTSDEGIPFTLDEVAFRPISLRPSPDELKSVTVQIQLVRAWLNALAQISDDNVRAQVRQALSHEVEELGITLRIFTDEFPNRMIGLYDAERQTMHALGMDADTRSKKGNR